MKPGVYTSVESLGRAAADGGGETYSFPAWVFRPALCEICTSSELYLLTETEAETLRALVEAWPLSMSQRRVAEVMRRRDVYWHEDTVKVVIGRLRRRTWPDIVVTIPGQGYRLNPESEMA